MIDLNDLATITTWTGKFIRLDFVARNLGSLCTDFIELERDRSISWKSQGTLCDDFHTVTELTLIKGLEGKRMTLLVMSWLIALSAVQCNLP